MATSPSPTHAASTPSTATEHKMHHSHHRAKKSNDPFLTRSLTAEVGDQFRQPAQGQQKDDRQQDHSLLADLIVTPLTMISFIFSLVLIDRQQRQWRLSQHSSEATAGWSRAWLDPEPYQAPAVPEQANEKAAPAKGGNDTTYSGWYTRKKKRAIARMEISDALEMRKRVAFALFVWSALVLWGSAYVLKCIYGWIVGA